VFEKSDIEIYSPVDNDDNTIVITDGDTDLKLMAITDNENLAVLVPVNEAKDPDGRTVKVLQLVVLQAIINKAFVPSAEPINSIAPEPSTASVVEALHLAKHSFWQQYQVKAVPNFKAETVAKYKAETDPNIFNVGQSYESPNGGIYTVIYRLGNRLQLRDNLGNTLVRNTRVDDGKEYFRPNLDSHCLYASETPAWFYAGGDITTKSLDRDCDLAGNFGRHL
jgi:hypothetical protein